ATSTASTEPSLLSATVRPTAGPFGAACPRQQAEIRAAMTALASRAPGAAPAGSASVTRKTASTSLAGPAAAGVAEVPAAGVVDACFGAAAQAMSTSKPGAKPIILRAPIGIIALCRTRQSGNE